MGAPRSLTPRFDGSSKRPEAPRQNRIAIYSITSFAAETQRNVFAYRNLHRKLALTMDG